MKKLFLFIFALVSCLNIVAQDSEGYFDVSRTVTGKSLRLIQSPNVDIQNKMTGDLETKKYVAYYNSLGIETPTKGKKTVKYKIGFLIMDHFDFSIPKNSRLLIKFKNGQTMTLTTADDNESDYKSISGLDRYYVSASYVVTEQQLNKIISQGISKIRIEAGVRNFDVIPEVDMAKFTKEFKVGIYDRYNNKKDSFTDGF